MTSISILSRMRINSPLLWVLFAIAVTVLAYVQALPYPFVSDDNVYIVDNTKLSSLPSVELWRLFIEPYNIWEYLPLRDLSYWVDMSVFGMSPSAFRSHNLTLYTLCLLLVYGNTAAVWKYFKNADDCESYWVAAAVAALFAFNPAHVEAVVWISGRKDLMSCLFSLLAIWLAFAARNDRGISARYAIGAMLAFMAAMMSKATAVSVAPVIALTWLVFLSQTPKSQKPRLALLWPFSVMLLAVLTIVVFSSFSTAKSAPYIGMEVVTRALAILGWMARLAITPESRHLLYPVFEDPYLPVMVALGLGVLMSALYSAARLLKQPNLVGYAIVCFVFLCFPYLQLMPYKTSSLVSDRFLMLAIWPISLVIVTLAWRIKKLPRTVILIVVALTWCFQTINRQHDWRAFEALQDHDIQGCTQCYLQAYQKVTEYQLPVGLYSDASQVASELTVPEARDIMVKLVETAKAMHDAATFGEPLDAMKRLEEFELLLRQPPAQGKWNPPMLKFWNDSRGSFVLEWQYMVKSFPNNISVLYNAGISLFRIRKYDEAITYLDEATKSNQLPESIRGKAFVLLGVALLNSGRFAEAEAPLRAALEQSPPDTLAYCALAEIYKRTDQPEKAARLEGNCASQSHSEPEVL